MVPEQFASPHVVPHLIPHQAMRGLDDRGGTEQSPLMLNATLLGQPYIRYGEQLVAFRSKRVLALLVYLALTNHSQARERLAAMFWPDHDDLTARKLLRNLVVLLRHNLADAAQMPYEAISLLRTEHDTLGRTALRIDLHGEPGLALDTQVTERAAAQARRLDQAHPLSRVELASAKVLDELQTAAQLYRGPFLDGIAFDDAAGLDTWIAQQRTYYQRQIEQILGALTHLHLEMGAFAEATRASRRWLEVNPFEEEATRRVMQALAAQGDRAGALAAYMATRQLLRKHLDAEPAPETVALAERLRHADPLVPTTTSESASLRAAQQPSRLGPGAMRDGVHIPFVGRSAEFATLVGIYEIARQRQSQLVMLGGEAGIGKTRLAEEFLRWVQTRGAVVLHASTLEMIGHLPFQPLVDALRPRIAQENAPDDLLPDPWLAEMIRLLPELHERYPDLPAPSAASSNDTTARGRLFEAVTQLIHALAVRANAGGVVLFLDNAQWMDAATLDLLQFAAHRWANDATPILVLLGARLEAFAIAPHLENWLTALAREVALTRLILPQLSFDETHRMLTSLGTWVCAPASHDDDPRRSQPGQLITWLYQRTGGQPFYLLQMLRTLLDQGVIRREQARDGESTVEVAGGLELSSLGRMVPGTVRDLVRSRVAVVNDVANDILVAASVLGQPATFEQLQTLAEVSEREALLALDDLLRRRLLVRAARDEEEESSSAPPQGSGKSYYTFPHDLLRETVYTEAGEDRRRIFHARAFQMFMPLMPVGSSAEQEMSAASVAFAAETARHALMGDLLEPTFRYSLAAGDAATHVLGAGAARGHYEQALRAARELERRQRSRGLPSSVSQADLERLQTQLGQACPTPRD